MTWLTNSLQYIFHFPLIYFSNAKLEFVFESKRGKILIFLLNKINFIFNYLYTNKLIEMILSYGINQFGINSHESF